MEQAPFQRQGKPLGRINLANSSVWRQVSLTVEGIQTTQLTAAVLSLQKEQVPGVLGTCLPHPQLWEANPEEYLTVMCHGMTKSVCLKYPRLDICFLLLGAVDPEILLRSLSSWKTLLKCLKAVSTYIKLILDRTIKKKWEGGKQGNWIEN